MNYIVVSIPNARDSTMHVVAIRTVTQDHVKAVEVARAAHRDQDADFVASILIYRIQQGQVYSMRDFVGDEGPGRENIVYISFKPMGKKTKWVETFRGEFEKLFADQIA